MQVETVTRFGFHVIFKNSVNGSTAATVMKVKPGYNEIGPECETFVDKKHNLGVLNTTKSLITLEVLNWVNLQLSVVRRSVWLDKGESSRYLLILYPVSIVSSVSIAWGVEVQFN